jgi:hypothetical protein
MAVAEMVQVATTVELTAKVVVAVAAFAEPGAIAKSPRTVAHSASLKEPEYVIVIPLGKACSLSVAWNAASKPDALVNSRLVWQSKIAHPLSIILGSDFSHLSKIAHHMADLYASLWALNQARPK